MSDFIGGNTSLIVPRGIPDMPPSVYDMTEIYEAEDRLYEVRTANPVSSLELMSYFNKVSNQTSKYLAWVDFEILEADKYLNIARATVILDKAPEELKKYKDSGIKGNEDFRNALIARDVDCQKRLDTLNMLKAVKALLEGKIKSFTRAYYTCQSVIESKKSLPQFDSTTVLGSTYINDGAGRDNDLFWAKKE